MRRYPLQDASRAKHLGIAKGNQHRSLGVLREATRNGDGAELLWAALARPLNRGGGCAHGEFDPNQGERQFTMFT